jgi:hypothetical protein
MRSKLVFEPFSFELRLKLRVYRMQGRRVGKPLRVGLKPLIGDPEEPNQATGNQPKESLLSEIQFAERWHGNEVFTA